MTSCHSACSSLESSDIESIISKYVRRKFSGKLEKDKFFFISLGLLAEVCQKVQVKIVQ